MIEKFILPKNLSELSKITNENYPVDKWSGAVVLLVIEDSILFIKRSETMPSHKGQIGMIGGHKLAAESEPTDTAFREFEEETGIKSNMLEVMGLSHGVKTSRNKVIIPVVCKYRGTKLDFMQDAQSNGEWTDLITTRISELKSKSYWKQGLIDKKYKVYFYSLNHFNSKCSSLNKEFNFVLWGATAKMILLFFKKHLDSGNKPSIK